jgi:membrane-bound ClpP family serine protease
VHSEDWQAKSEFRIPAGQKIRVTDIDGLTLIVEPDNLSKEELS